ncbi:ribonuclease H-like protein [Trametes polyzona]|nr:ribonuclease H-like protein [Trametes polyzona]
MLRSILASTTRKCLRPSLARSLRTHMEAKSLDWQAGPLVWIDCEMTGLDPRTDKILEIAVLITNGNLEIVDEGISYVIRTDKEVLDNMGTWCQNTHGASGLTEACIDSPFTKDFVEQQVLNYIKKWIPKAGHGVLAGNSVHMDRAFLVGEMPSVTDWLHYRFTLHAQELARRWYRTSSPVSTSPEAAHRALDDIKGSIRELQWYRKNLFLPPNLAPTIELGRRY